MRIRYSIGILVLAVCVAPTAMAENVAQNAPKRSEAVFNPQNETARENLINKKNELGRIPPITPVPSVPRPLTSSQELTRMINAMYFPVPSSVGVDINGKSMLSVEIPASATQGTIHVQISPTSLYVQTDGVGGGILGPTTARTLGADGLVVHQPDSVRKDPNGNIVETTSKNYVSKADDGTRDFQNHILAMKKAVTAAKLQSMQKNDQAAVKILAAAESVLEDIYRKSREVWKQN